MKVEVYKQWETIHCVATKGEQERSIELTINHETGNFRFCTGHQEHIEINTKDIVILELTIKALQAGLKHLKENL